MIIAITGHANIEKALGMELLTEDGSSYNHDAYKKVYHDIIQALIKICDKHNITFNQLTLVSGMARGVDEIFAAIAIHYKLPLILSIPSSIRWHKDRDPSRGIRAQAVYYDYILKQPNIIKIFEIKKNYNNGNYHFVNMARNQHMVDIANIVISYRVSTYDSNGTDDCIKRAKEQNKYYGNVEDINKEL